MRLRHENYCSSVGLIPSLDSTGSWNIARCSFTSIARIQSVTAHVHRLRANGDHIQYMLGYKQDTSSMEVGHKHYEVIYNFKLLIPYRSCYYRSWQDVLASG